MLDTLIMLTAVMLIVLSLLQGGKSAGISSAFGGGGGGLNLFANVKERGPEKMISRLTLILGIVFFGLIILVKII